MRTLTVLAAVLAVALPLASAASDSGGISGILRTQAGVPLPYTAIAIEGYGTSDARSVKKTLTTDANGFFVDLTLPEGNYALVAQAENQTFACAQARVNPGIVSRVTMHGGDRGELRCRLAGNGLVDPNQTADLYRI